jgi:hypothetical protein
MLLRPIGVAAMRTSDVHGRTRTPFTHVYADAVVTQI